MSFILKIAFIAGAVLALPNPGDLLPRQDRPQPKGTSQGAPFDNLTLTIYDATNCKGKPSKIYTGNYGFYEPFQTQSYSLSRLLSDDETLDFYSGPGEYDPAKNSHYTEQCWQFSARAGINATTDKDQNAARQSGCHTLTQTQWNVMGITSWLGWMVEDAGMHLQWRRQVRKQIYSMKAEVCMCLAARAATSIRPIGFF